MASSGDWHTQLKIYDPRMTKINQTSNQANTRPPSPNSFIRQQQEAQQQEEIPGSIQDQNCRTELSSHYSAQESQQEFNGGAQWRFPPVKEDMSLQVQEPQTPVMNGVMNKYQGVQGQDMAVMSKFQGERDAIMPVMPVASKLHGEYGAATYKPQVASAPRGVEGHLAKLTHMLKREAWVTDYMLVRMSRTNLVLQLVVAVLPVSMAVLLSFAFDVSPEDSALRHSITLFFVTGHLIAVYLLNHLKLPSKICDAERMLKVTEGLLNRVTLAQSRPNVRNIEELLMDVESKIDSLTKDYCFSAPKWAYRIFDKQAGGEDHDVLC